MHLLPIHLENNNKLLIKKHLTSANQLQYLDIKENNNISHSLKKQVTSHQLQRNKQETTQLIS